jgi:hypothetical protein
MSEGSWWVQELEDVQECVIQLLNTNPVPPLSRVTGHF